MEFFQVKGVTEAQEELLFHLVERTPRVEKVKLDVAVGRVLAQDIYADQDVPNFSRSTVDGYAVRAADTFGAGEGLPAYLEVVGEVHMGCWPEWTLHPGTAVKIPTGGMLPEGADAVVMVEYTEVLEGGTIEVTRPVAPGENVIRRGEDIAAGQRVLEQGKTLRPHDVGALAAAGKEEIPVAVPPRVAILSTGDEVVPPGTRAEVGQVRDINGPALAAAVREDGGNPVLLGIVPDRYEELLGRAKKALENDLILISGGSSVGTRDVTAGVIEALGPPGILAHGVSVRPGKPTILAVVQGKPVLGLPGHPASALVAYGLFVRPLIRRLLGAEPETFSRPVAARISRNIASAAGREDHIRVVLKERNGELWAEPVLGKSGLISTLVKADGTVVIPAAREGLTEGEAVKVQLC